MSLGSPMSDVITTVQCSIPSQLNNKPRVMVTDLGCTIPAIIIVWPMYLRIFILRIYTRRR